MGSQLHIHLVYFIFTLCRYIPVLPTYMLLFNSVMTFLQFFFNFSTQTLGQGYPYLGNLYDNNKLKSLIRNFRMLIIYLIYSFAQLCEKQYNAYITILLDSYLIHILFELEEVCP